MNLQLLVLFFLILLLHHQLLFLHLKLLVQLVQQLVLQIVLDHGYLKHVKIIIIKIIQMYVKVVILLGKLVLELLLLLFLLAEMDIP